MINNSTVTLRYHNLKIFPKSSNFPHLNRCKIPRTLPADSYIIKSSPKKKLYILIVSYLITLQSRSFHLLLKMNIKLFGNWKTKLFWWIPFFLSHLHARGFMNTIYKRTTMEREKKMKGKRKGSDGKKTHTERKVSLINLMKMILFVILRLLRTMIWFYEAVLVHLCVTVYLEGEATVNE